MLALILLLIQPPSEFVLQGTISFLHLRRMPDGSYSSDIGNRFPNLANTSAALRSFKNLGAKPDEVSKTKAYIWSCFDTASGQFRDSPAGTPSYRTTAIGIMAVAALGERFTPADLSRLQVTLLKSDKPEEIRLGAAAIETLVLDGQLSKVPGEWQAKLTRVFKPDLLPDGSYGTGLGKARTTGGYYAAFLRLGYPIANKEAILALLIAQQHTSGGWTNEKGEPDLEATYRVMRCLHLLQCKDKDVYERCQRFCKGYEVGTGAGFALPARIGPQTAQIYYISSILQWIGKQ
ncbi:MAG: prenyltransferase/squalene oxidase repeat-containing protein [Gemmatales bacterium]